MPGVLWNDELGVYLGTAFGLGFWSKLDPAGQEYACVFETEDEAREYVSSWDNPVSFRFVIVEWSIVSGYKVATIGSCVRAGLEGWIPDGEAKPDNATVQ